MDLYVLDDVSEGRRAFVPGPQQLHCLVEVHDVVSIHPQVGCMLQQNIPQAWAIIPKIGATVQRFSVFELCLLQTTSD